MDRDKFIKHRWKAYQTVIYKNDRMKNWDGGLGVEVECMVCCINFDEETMLLQTLDKGIFTDEEFYANIKNIEIARPKLSVLGKKIKEENCG